MERLLIQRPSGLRAIGGIGEGNGFGFRAIGRGDRGPMPIGYLAVGNQETGVGSGSKAIGSTDRRDRFKFHVSSCKSMAAVHEVNSELVT